MDLVTVVCDKDREMQRLQSHSIDTYVQGNCTHWVILEDSKWTVEQWQTMLAPYYTKHTLRVITLPVNAIPSEGWRKDGWVMQQIYKLRVAELIEADRYLVLDTKNFFINAIDLDNWPSEEGDQLCHLSSDLTSEVSKQKWQNWIKYIEQQLGMPVPEHFWALSTPFMLKTDIVKKILARVNVDQMFIDYNTPVDGVRNNPSEFILYSFFSDTTPANIPSPERIYWTYGFTFAPHDAFPSDERLEEHYNNTNFKVFGLHRRMLQDPNPLELKRIIDKLTAGGLNYIITSRALLSYIKH